MFQKLSVVLSILALGLLILPACNNSQVVAPEPTSKPVSEPTEAVQATVIEPTETPEMEKVVETSEEVAAEEPTITATVEATEEVVVEVTEEAAEVTEAADTVRTFIIVPERTKASYIVDEEFLGGSLDRLGISPGLVDTIGSTQEVEGELQLSLNDPSPLVLGHFVVNIQSLTSDQSRRDKQIRQRWLESNTYPLAEFTATGLENVPQEYAEGQEVTFKVNGDMTIREITNPVTLDVTAILTGDTITGIAVTQLKMTDFGFDPPSIVNIFDVGNEFTVEVEFTFKEQ